MKYPFGDIFTFGGGQKPHESQGAGTANEFVLYPLKYGIIEVHLPLGPLDVRDWLAFLDLSSPVVNF